MMGASAIFPAILIALFCLALAFFAFVVAAFGVFFWQRKRGLSLILLVPSILYLATFVYLFAPRPLPHYSIALDLRKPTDLSGLPEKTKWLPAHGPQLTPIVPLSLEGASGAFGGNVEITVTLPDGQVIHDRARNVYIEVDDAGIWKVTVMVEDIAPRTALAELKTWLWPMVLNGTTSGGSSAQLSAVEQLLQTYASRAPIWKGLRLTASGYKLDFTLTTTFLPSSNISYNYEITVPHTPLYQRFTALPLIERPEQLLQDAHELIGSGARRKIPKEQWPPSISRLNPSSVHIYRGKILVVFDINPVVGYHCYAVGMASREEDRAHLYVKSDPYPGITEVWWHDQTKEDLQ